jgi:hypothetical protein
MWGDSPSLRADDSPFPRAHGTRILDGAGPTLSLPAVNRPLRDRMTALLAAVLFLLSGAGDAFGAHPCPHHAAITAPHAPAAIAAPAADATDAAHRAHAHHTPPAAPAEHDGHDACTCGGVCPVSAGAVPLPAPGFGHLSLLARSPAPAARADDARLPARRIPHFLPFAQAPPPQA